MKYHEKYNDNFTHNCKSNINSFRDTIKFYF